jgi:hypothetical protein
MKNFDGAIFEGLVRSVVSQLEVANMTAEKQSSDEKRRKIMVAVPFIMAHPGFRPSFSFVPVVEVKVSALHGQGVFASVDVLDNTFLTFYPADIVFTHVRPNQGFDTNRESIICVSKRLCKHVENNKQAIQTGAADLHAYTFDMDDHTSLAGDPIFTTDAACVGHMINDGCKPDDTKITADVYKVLSTAQANCVFHVFPGALIGS